MNATPDLRLGLLLRIFGVLAVVFVGTLAVAPAKSMFTEWRDAQDEYNRRALPLGISPVETGLRQIWNPDLDVVDRCTSCHLGMGDADPLPGAGPFAKHPAIPHDPAEMGCTPCHSGQGRATKKDAAHGHAEFWFEPMLERERLEAGCGSCHSAIPVGSFAAVDRGRLLFARYDCLACHRLDGRGGGRAAPAVMPDLSGIGLKGVPEGWHETHLEKRASEPEGLFGECYGEIPAEDRADLGAFLATLSGMPRVAEGKRLFHEKGCRGCHLVNGVGGTEGADLTLAGTKNSFDWQVSHLLAPAEVVADSRMPDQGLTRTEAEKIALYLVSLRGRDLPAGHLPPDRVRAERLGERDFGTDGATLFATFCAACHGARGDGRGFGQTGEAFPAVRNPDFLSVASDALIRRTIEAGRPGRRMAAWAGMEAGLRPAEIRRLSGWLREGEATPPALEAVRAAPADPARGRELYLSECSVCHGREGEGGIGPSHRSAAFGGLASDELLYRTITGGRPGTAMPRFREFDAADLRSLMETVRSFSGAALAPPEPTHPGDPTAGAPVYAGSCAECHGPDGEGGIGPGIGKPGFWAAGSPEILVASYARGRCRDELGARPPPVGAAALADAAAWLRRRAERGDATLPGRRAAGNLERGRVLYGRACAGCHGAKGEGKEAPALANPAFLGTANDDFLRATIARGRRGTAMPRFDLDQRGHPRLGAGEIDDIVTFVRGFADGGTAKE